MADLRQGSASGLLLARINSLFAGASANAMIAAAEKLATLLRAAVQPGSFGFSYLKRALSSLNGGGEKLIVANQLVPVGRLAAPVNSQIM